MLLRAADIHKSYPGVQALKGVSLELQASEVHALVGENGAGKSTLIRILTGAETPDSGSLDIGGETFAALDPELARRLGIAVIYQQPALFPTLSVAENLALRCEPSGLWRRVDWRARRERARSLLERVGAHIDVERTAASLSAAEQQLVAIAAALGVQARVLILDEPTACLPEHDAERLLDLVRTLRSQGVGLIYITHRLEELFGLADRVTVLRDGESVASAALADVDIGTLIRWMVGRELLATPRTESSGRPEVALSVSGLGCRAGGLSEVSFELREGEILGLAGLVGAGRSELARALFGLTPAEAGEIRLGGETVTIREPRDAVAHGMAYVPEDRRRHGVVGAMSTVVNTSLAVLERVSRNGFLQPARERALAEPLARQLDLRAASLEAPVANLSGGNQQKVALARWLAAEPRVLIVDEPTQGIDVGAKAEIHRILGELAAAGKAILLISSDLPELLALSDRVAVMRERRLVAILPRAEAMQEAVLALALGHREGVAG
ncbi:MAG: sugar ABC transporter ATP-binding protein [Armatimonadetes bacterium]|nr:sugar ABC transporter ATP-binding protein [Armatimonadota bacterium]